MEYKHEVIMCVVNAGYSEMVMEVAREFGARGGTVLHARGTANIEAEKRFNIPIQPEKEVVMILVEQDIKEAILHALYQKVGLSTQGKGIAFCLPVDDVVGLTKTVDLPKEAQPEPQNEQSAEKSSEKQVEDAKNE